MVVVDVAAVVGVVVGVAVVVVLTGLGVIGLPGVSGLGLLSKSDPTGMIFFRPPEGVS